MSRASSVTTIYPPIEDYGLIGDCHSAALVSSHGSIDWLCLPRFDSPSIFARILDAERTDAWSLHPTGQFHSRHQYLEHTNVLETSFTSDQGRVRLLDFMPIVPEATSGTVSSLRTVVRIVEGIDGETEIESVCSPRPGYGRAAPTFVMHGTEVTFDRCRLTGPTEWQANEATGAISCRTTVRSGERLAFVLRYEAADRHPAVDVNDPFDELQATIDFWRSWAARCTYQGPYRDAAIRSALTLKLLLYTPTGAIVAAPTTSLPEEIGGVRNWDYRFTWIRDASFTLYALLLAGYTYEVDAFFQWIVRTVRLEETGIRILYPATPDGETTERRLDSLAGYRDSPPVRIGNAAAGQVQLDVYGEVLDALYFASKAGRYDPAPIWAHFRPLVDWVTNHWRRPDSGIWEVRGGLRHFVYSKVMLWVALDRAIKLVEDHDLLGDAEHWRQARDQIRAEVFERGWSDKLKAFKQSYEDERLDAANLILPIVGFIDGDDPRMVSTIDATLDQLVVDGLCYRYLDAPEGIPGGEAAFVLCTFWLIDALMLAGRTQQAEELFARTLQRASSLGLFAEEIDPTTGAHLGNFPQAFSHLGVISAAVSLAQAGKAGRVKPKQAEAASRAGIGGGGQDQQTYSGNKADA
jgi:GH15 family glucan-1,4-alpha-glucosidase